MNRTFTILVADDDADDQTLITDALREIREEFEIIKLQNGVEVLDYLLKRNRFANVTRAPDLILLDLNMPLLDGFEVLKGIRLHEAISSVPVYVITVSTNPSDEKKARAMGAAGFYSKGARVDTIKTTVKEILGKTLSQRESKRN